ncbi:MAG TPA: hypothetical protein DCP90_07765 [Clostridiales bacterium]|nr:MAG: hypothetical protein A2Y22_01330 [Clostridiales bacterium GWD2_32_59]HAN10495.1 hypothetical protein [Clostridiales bacterium]
MGKVFLPFNLYRNANAKNWVDICKKIVYNNAKNKIIVGLKMRDEQENIETIGNYLIPRTFKAIGEMRVIEIGGERNRVDITYESYGTLFKVSNEGGKPYEVMLLRDKDGNLLAGVYYSGAKAETVQLTFDISTDDDMIGKLTDDEMIGYVCSVHDIGTKLNPTSSVAETACELMEKFPNNLNTISSAGFKFQTGNISDMQSDDESGRLKIEESKVTEYHERLGVENQDIGDLMVKISEIQGQGAMEK